MDVVVGFGIFAAFFAGALKLTANIPWLFWPLAIGGGLFILVLFVGGIAQYKVSKSPEGQREEKRAEEWRRMMFSPPSGFPAQPAFIGSDGRIALNSKSQELAIGNPTGWSIFPYEDVFGAELDVGEGQVTKTSSSRSLVGAVVGGATFGAVGAIVGGTGGKTTSTTSKVIEHVVLRVQVKDMESPVREVFFRKTKFGPDAEKAQQQGREWLARIQMIVDENERNPVGRSARSVSELIRQVSVWPR